MKNLYVALILCLLMSLGGVPTASALTISPVKIEVSGDPGQTLVGEVELLNEQTATKTFFTSFENFEPSGDTGSPRFIGSDDGLATWLQAAPEAVVAPGTTVKIPFTISIPAKAEPGGSWASARERRCSIRMWCEAGSCQPRDTK